MHGRLKVRTSAEEAARKKKEQEIKLKQYRAGIAKILSKRKALEYDEEMMDLTGKILSGNPDVYTMWNIRKECIQKFNEITKDEEIYKRDLDFTELCLQKNPKSYGGWHHRCWIMENSPNPNWKNEMELCNKYLKVDERNFHCWDYRRYVAGHAKEPPENELQYCVDKIEMNFSNYSSWHYKSKLLLALYPNKTDRYQPIEEKHLEAELEKVLTATFTDPNDSSAWFYQRWLLGYSAPDLDIAAFRLFDNSAIISFTKPINLHHGYYVTSNFCADLQFRSWQPLQKNSDVDITWILSDTFFSTDESVNDACVYLKDSKTSTEFSLPVSKSINSWYGIRLPKFEYEFGPDTMNIFKEQLKSCHELLDLEPNNKWTLLAMALLLRAVDRKGNLDKTIEYLEKLETVDEMRKGYYQDLSSKWRIQNCLEDWMEQPTRLIDLSGLKITSLFYENYLAIFEQINLSNNLLADRNLGKLIYLQSCWDLDLRQNRITSIEDFPALRFLGRLCVDEVIGDFNDLCLKCTRIGQFERNGTMLMRCFF